MFRDAREIDVVPGEVRVHGMVYVGAFVLDVDLLIECVLALGEVRGAREGVGAVIGDGVDPRLQDGLFGRCPGREETEVVSEGRGQRARQRRAESSSEDQQRRWTFESRMRVMTSSRGGRGGGQRGLTRGSSAPRVPGPLDHGELSRVEAYLEGLGERGLFGGVLEAANARRLGANGAGRELLLWVDLPAGGAKDSDARGEVGRDGGGHVSRCDVRRAGRRCMWTVSSVRQTVKLYT